MIEKREGLLNLISEIKKQNKKSFTENRIFRFMLLRAEHFAKISEISKSKSIIKELQFNI